MPLFRRNRPTPSPDVRLDLIDEEFNALLAKDVFDHEVNTVVAGIVQWLQQLNDLDRDSAAYEVGIEMIRRNLKRSVEGKPELEAAVTKRLRELMQS